MKHFFGYKADGVLASVETYSPGGWPACDCHPGCTSLADPECMSPPVVELRGRRASRNPDIAGFIEYNCPCPPNDPVCELGCYNTYMSTHYVNTQTMQFVAKPTATFDVGGVTIAEGQVVDVDPAAQVNLKIVSGGTPDTETVDVFAKSDIDIFDTGSPTVNLEFTSGETAVQTIYGPPQGMRVPIVAYGKYTRPMSIIVRGWPTV